MALELFDAFGSAEKTLNANMGGHTGVPEFAGRDTALLRPPSRRGRRPLKPDASQPRTCTTTSKRIPSLIRSLSPDIAWAQ